MAVTVNPQNRYPCVGPTRDGKQRATPVHVLVALAFHGPRPEGMEVRHLDGTRTNNRPENLAWGTHSENMQDKVAHGTATRPLRTHCINGHEYDAKNTRIAPRGERRCRRCDREQTAARRAAQRREIAQTRELRVAA